MIGMGSVPGTTLLYGGCSAGSRGAQAHGVRLGLVIFHAKATQDLVTPCGDAGDMQLA